MKSKLPLLLGISAVVVAVFLMTRPSTDNHAPEVAMAEDANRTKSSPEPAATEPETSSDAVPPSRKADHLGPATERMPRPEPLAPLDLVAAIPDAGLRQRVAALPLSAQREAVRRFERLSIPAEDLASLGVTGDGRFYYLDDINPHDHASHDHETDESGSLAPDANESRAAVPPSGDEAAAAVPIATPPVRHSRPGSANVLYLDFNGHTITNTSWNSGTGREPTYIGKVYDTDGDPASFSDDEQADIIEIWERVAEDFSPFDVNVTTEEPATFTSTTGRALITENVDANGNNMPSSSGGGVAQLDVFGDSDYHTRGSPAFVYFNNFSGNEANIAEAVTHELGHNMGLTHDGQTGVEYYNGHGSGAISWGPIMGASYGRNVTQWSKGEYHDANNPQDDFAIIAAKLAFSGDEAGDTTGTAAAAAVTGSDISNTGVIASSEDVDMYSFSTAAGTVQLNVNTYRVSTGTHGGNADLKLELLDVGGSVLATHDPANNTNATISLGVGAGTYFARITPVGDGSPLVDPPTGYTSYGSAGQYTLTGTIIAAAPSITSATTASVAAGAEFNYAIIGTNGPTSYGATGLPSGLSVDTGTGLISGRLTVVGEFSVALSATNSLGTGNATLTLTVTDSAPVITAQTSGRVLLTPGTTTSLSVTAISANGTPTYQWQRNGRDIIGATGATLDIDPSSPLVSGYYRVIVTNSIGATPSEALFALYAPATTEVVAWGLNDTGQTAVPEGLDDAIAVTSGTSHALALKRDGSVVAWGSNNQGEREVPAGLTDVVKIAAGDNVSFALKSDGTLAVWGRDGFTLASPPDNLDDVVDIASFGFHGLALEEDGTVVGWGTNGSGQITMPSSMGQVVEISAGASTSYALNDQGTVFVWGFGPNGDTTPPAVSPLWSMLSGGGFHALGLKSDGTIEGWGFSTFADPPSGLTNLVGASAGTDHSLGLSGAGTVTSWGNNTEGESTIPTGLADVFAIEAGNDFSLAIREIVPPAAPAIIAQPQAQTVTVGASVSFTVSATGVPVPTFQWRKAGVNISGATSATLTIDTTSTDDAGSYDVVATNASGSATSDTVTLTVQTPPIISAHPQSQTVTVGSQVTLTVTATGDPAPTYQWRKGGVDLDGETSASLNLGTVALVDSGGYDVVVTNAAGSITSASATVTVQQAPSISAQPQSQTVLIGADVTLTVTAGGTPAPTYQWRKNSVELTGATSASLQLDDVTADAAGSYDVVVTNAVDSVTSDAATLTVQFAPAFSQQPQSQTVNSGANVVLSVVVTGVPLPTLQWRKDDQNISGATTATLDLGAVSPGANGSYDVVATNTVAATTSAAATVTVLFGPSINASPVSQTVEVGDAVTLTVSATGDPAPIYQWRKDGENITGATNASFAIASATLDDAADYDVVVTNTVSSQASSPATLTVHAAPAITGQPQSQTVEVGTEVTLAVTATGNPTPTYQWKKDGAPIAGATSASLALGAVELDDAANYTVDVLNVVDTAISNAAVLTVQQAPEITAQPISRAVQAGTSVAFTVEATGTPEPSFQWRKDGVNIEGATNASLGLSGVAIEDAGSYTVAVFNDVGTVVSEAATLSVVSVSATHESSGYRVGETVTVSNTVTYAGSLMQVVWSVVPPAEIGGQKWILSSFGGTAAEVSPDVGTTDLLEWTWNTVPASPFSFEYTLLVPAATVGDQSLAAMLDVTSAAGISQVMATPDPLTLSEATAFHSADTDSDFRINLSELLRVIELYNTREGTTRTGGYRNDGTTNDGFAPDASGSATSFHLADTDRDSRINLSELLRVIELYNTRSGTTRTGAYRIDESTTDGFAPDV
jgi:hypothetical protein